ncbi:hypothetical protein PIB30_100817 [Stylosanthes scabra]|uniref:Uncharacterized protein n=1 Tax=Stylosanthes scabra TaxID=79078 RepID=A0ABU6QWM1_9FABA|nr:hypothetical protein [Stylosanthes scabra]
MAVAAVGASHTRFWGQWKRWGEKRGSVSGSSKSKTEAAMVISRLGRVGGKSAKGSLESKKTEEQRKQSYRSKPEHPRLGATTHAKE